MVSSGITRNWTRKSKAVTLAKVMRTEVLAVKNAVGTDVVGYVSIDIYSHALAILKNSKGPRCLGSYEGQSFVLCLPLRHLDQMIQIDRPPEHLEV